MLFYRVPALLSLLLILALEFHGLSAGVTFRQEISMQESAKLQVSEASSKMSTGPSGALLYCLCQIESNCNVTYGCEKDPVTLSCGPLQIKEDDWKDASEFAGKPIGGDWLTCTTGPKSLQCSWQMVLYYMARYGKQCTGGKKPTDEDYARIHNGGPTGCKKSATIGYWKKVKACMEK